MERLIQIDGKEMRMVANGATARVYRMMFGKDLLVEIQRVTTKGEEGRGTEDMEVIENLAFVLGRQAGSIPKDMELIDWLGTMEDPFAVWNAAGDIISLWASNTQTIADPKNQGGQQSAH